MAKKHTDAVRDSQKMLQRARLPTSRVFASPVPRHILPFKAAASVQAMPCPKPCRSLHYVFKIGDRKESTDFLQHTLLMTVLRHEEFTEGCAAACNGPYDNRWSKSMIGYNNEDQSFVLELTYNYTVKSYRVGNDFNSMTIHRRDAFSSVKSKGVGKVLSDRTVQVTSPEGHSFTIVDEDIPGPNPITEVTLNVQDLQKSLAFWSGFLAFTVEQQDAESATLRPGAGQTALTLRQLPAGTAIDRGTGYGRIAFACPGDQLQQLERDVKAAGYTIHTPYVSLDTPGKATVQVVILQDPDSHEICFVGDEGFKDLSRVDAAAPRLLAEAIEEDKSAEWEAKRKARELAMAAKGV